MRLEAEGLDLHVEPEVALAARAGIEADDVGHAPRVSEILDETVGLLVETARPRIVAQAGQRVEAFVEMRPAVDMVVLDLMAEKIIGESQRPGGAVVEREAGVEFLHA